MKACIIQSCYSFEHDRLGGACRYIDIGIDTVLTNEVSNAVKQIRILTI